MKTLEPAIALNFAEDKKLIKIIRSIDDTIDLQISIESFFKWRNDNGPQINIGKSKVLSITLNEKSLILHDFIDGVKIERVNEMTDLGVTVDSKLSFSAHIEYVTNKSKAALSFVKKACRNQFEIENAKLFHCFLSKLNIKFAGSIWLPFVIF